MEDGRLYTQDEIADEICVPRANIAGILSAIDDARIMRVEHACIPGDTALYRRSDCRTSLRDIRNKLRGMKGRERSYSTADAATRHLSDIMVRFCRKPHTP